jgi:hypothetical protein
MLMPSDSLPVRKMALLDHVRDTTEDMLILFFVLSTVALSLLFVVVACKVDHVKDEV